MMKVALFLTCTLLAITIKAEIVKREIPHHGKFDLLDYGYNKIDHFDHYPHYVHAPPAYSTISVVQSHHSKPTSYSGFTNHGRGHHDPGYAIEFRSEGFHHPIPHHFGHHHDYY